MNVTYSLHPFGKYLLHSGEVVFGATDLYTMNLGTANIASYYEAQQSFLQSNSNALNNNLTRVQASRFATRYNSVTRKTEVLCYGLPVTPPSSYTVPCVFALLRPTPLVVSWTMAHVALFTVEFSPTEPAVAARPYMLSFSDNVLFTL